jgi:hypothetical protein
VSAKELLERGKIAQEQEANANVDDDSQKDRGKEYIL